MAISIEPAPDSLDELVADSLRSLPPADGWAAFGDAQILSALPVYSAPLECVARADGDYVPEMRRTGWRVLAILAEDAAVVDMRYVDDVLAVVAVTRGGSAERLGNASATIEDAADPERDWDAAILDLPEVEVDALILRSAQGGLAVRMDAAEPEVTDVNSILVTARELARLKLEDLN